MEAATRSGFNPRARVGRDEALATGKMTINEFQSTRPRGARPKGHQVHGGAAMFQSTRPRGARHGTGVKCYDSPEFQSTRPRGARPGQLSMSSP